MDTISMMSFDFSVEKYINILNKIGFNLVFKSEFSREDHKIDTVYIFIHKEGMLLVCDSYGDTINSSVFWYNLKPKPNKNLVVAGSGFYNSAKKVWIGYCDARHLIKEKIASIKKNGKFLNKWVEVHPSLYETIKTFALNMKDDKKAELIESVGKILCKDFLKSECSA